MNVSFLAAISVHAEWMLTELADYGPHSGGTTRPAIVLPRGTKGVFDKLTSKCHA